MNLTLNAGGGLVAFVFEHGPLFATVVNERDRDLAPRKQISMGVPAS